MNDFATIGFATKGEWNVQTFQELLDLAARKGEWLKTLKGGYYVKLVGEGGEEIWGQANPDKELIGGHPHFNGQSRNTFLYQPYFKDEYSPLDASIYSHIQVDAGGTDYPLFIDCPEFFLHKERKETEKITLQITAFARQDIRIYDSYKSYQEANKNNSLAEEALIPVGTFNPDGSHKDPTAHALFAGTILEVKEVTNSFTGEKFYYLYVNSLSAKYDVVVSLYFIKEIPKVGCFIEGIFWMSGKVIES